MDCSLKRARGDNLVGGDELDRRVAARSDCLQILAGSRSRDRSRGARHVGQQRPVGRRSLRIVGGIPGNGRLASDVDAIGGRAIGTLGLHRRLDAVARNKMGRIAVDLRERDHAQQVVLPRCGNAVERNPLNGVVKSARRKLNVLAHESVADRQRAGLGVNAVSKLNPIGIVLALGIPRDRKLGIRRQFGIGPARGPGNLDTRSKRRANGKHRSRRLLGRNGLKRILAGNRHRTHGVHGLRAAIVLLLRALDRILARRDHANVLAHHIVGRRIRRRIGRIGNVLKMAIEGALVVRILPLVVNLIRCRNAGIGVALGRLRRQRLAYGNLPRLQSTRDLDAI